VGLDRKTGEDIQRVFTKELVLSIPDLDKK